MTGIFRANNPYNHILLFVYGILLKLPMFLHPVVPKPQQLDGFLYRGFLQWMEANHAAPIFYSLITFLLLFSQALSFNRVVNNQRLLQKSTYLPGMSYLLITSLFAEWNILSAPLIVNSILIWILSRLCRLHNHPNPKTLLFDTGWVTGLATFFYFPSIAFLLLIIVGLAITRPFRFQEWLLILLGMITPYYFLFSWIFLTDSWNYYSLRGFTVTLPWFYKSTYSFIAIGMISAAVLLGIYFIQANLGRQIVQTRKSWGLVFLYLLVALFVPFINAAHSFDYWILAAVPISVFAASSFLYPERRWFPIVMHWGMVILSIAAGYSIIRF